MRGKEVGEGRRGREVREGRVEGEGEGEQEEGEGSACYLRITRVE